MSQGRDSAAVLQRRLDYYRMVAEAAATQPTVVVIEDTDTPPGVGAFWGEVNVAIHLGLEMKGVLTNGSMRDLGDVDDASRFWPVSEYDYIYSRQPARFGVAYALGPVGGHLMARITLGGIGDLRR